MGGRLDRVPRERGSARLGTCDLEILKAELAGCGSSPTPASRRVRDPSSGRRWYLAPDEAGPRELDLERALQRADRDVEQAAERVDDQQREEKQRTDERELRDSERFQRQGEERELVRAFLTEHGPSTAKEIAAGTGLNSFAADQAAKAVAKRGKGQRFTVTTIE